MLKQLLFAELDYSRFSRISIGPVLGIIAYKLLVQSAGFNTLVAVLLALLVISFYTVWIKENRQRHFILLPLSPTQIAIIRILKTALPLLVFYTVFILMSLLKNNPVSEWNESIAEILLLLAFTFSGFAFYYAFMDWMAEADQASRYITGTFAYLSTILLIIAISACFINLYTTHYYIGIALISAFLLLSLALIIYTIRTFNRRKSYLK